MFDSLSDRLGAVFDRLRGRGALTEADVRGAMREVRIALLEADVALPVVREFVDKATEQAVGQQVLRSVTPGQQVVKIVHDALVEMLGAEASELEVDVTPPAVVMMVGLQGSGKTTSTAKIARRLREKGGKKVMMASLDVARPAAQEQLRVLGEKAEVATLPIVAGQQPVDIARRALDDHPPTVVVHASSDKVVLDVNGIRLTLGVHRVGEVSFVDSPEGSVALRELSRFPLPAPEAAEGSLIAPLPGAVRRVLVVPGQRVRAGELLLTLEAMKLEHPVHAPSAGVVASLPVQPGAEVDTGELLAVLDPE